LKVHHTLYDREADTGTLYHGDLGWEHPQMVEEGGLVLDAVLDDAETLWLRACWLAAVPRSHGSLASA